MRRGLTTAALLAVLSTPAVAFKGKCLLEVNNTPYVLGPCDVEINKDGPTIVTGPRGKYFAYVFPDGDKAEASWNGLLKGATHAHSPLGTLTKSGACWINETAKICAWR